MSSSDWQVGCCECISVGVCVSSATSMLVQPQAVNRVTNSGTCSPCCLNFWLCCIGRFINRNKIKQALNIQSPEYYDCLLCLFCPVCAICQEYNEVYKRVPP